MKKIIVSLILASGVTAIAFAAFDSSTSTNKKMKQKRRPKQKRKKNANVLAYSVFDSPVKSLLQSGRLFYFTSLRLYFQNYLKVWNSRKPFGHWIFDRAQGGHGLDHTENGLFFSLLLFKVYRTFSYPQLIFCQKKILPIIAWQGQNKTTKFGLLTLLKT